MRRSFQPLSRRVVLAVLLALGTALSMPAAFAGSSAGSVASSVTLASSCTLAANPLAFGSVSGIAPNAMTQTTLGISCTNGTPYVISMNGGISQGVSNNIAWRYLVSTTLVGGTKWEMAYQIFQDSARSQQWGNTVGSNTVAGTGTGAQQSFPVYGTIPSTAGDPTVSYSDTITVSVAY